MDLKKWISLITLAAATVAVEPRAIFSIASAAGAKTTSPSAVLATVGGRGGSGRVVSLGYGNESAPQGGEDKTLAPYLYVAGGDPEVERLPLKETRAEVQIAGVIAQVKVRQVFENAGTKPIEAIYVFPASTRAAVHGMRMKIGTRVVEARIERTKRARDQYEQAKRDGKRASLLEQQRPNVFTMNVANLMPRDRIEVELDYSELMVPEEGVYEFVYPALVGPRYAGGAAPGDTWIANPYLKEGEKEPYRFDLRCHVETGIALKELASPSHPVAVNYLSKGSADVTLKESGGGNRDFVLRYRLAGDQIETGLLLWRGEQESFFTLMMEPPQRPTDAQIPPREYIFLLDVSGSMHGFPLETAKVLMRDLIAQLRPSDFLNIALFSGASFVMNPEGSIPATSANLSAALALVEKQRGGGGTELMGGLEAAYRIPKRQGVSRSVVVVTDGYVGVEASAYQFVRERLDQSNLFAFGIGSSVNRALIEGLARAGQGEPFVVLRPEKAKEQAERLRAYIQSPVLAGVQLKFQGFDAYEVAPMKVPDLLARRPVVVFGKYRGEPRGSIELTGTAGGGSYRQTMEVQPAGLKPQNAPLRWLWARKWVSILDDERALAPAPELEEAIADLGLAYNLLTAFTSFLAVDSLIARRGGETQTVQQPLPLPQGVSEYALGATRGGGGFGKAGFGGFLAPARQRLSAGASAPASPPMAAPVQAAAASVDSDTEIEAGPAPKEEAPREARTQEVKRQQGIKTVVVAEFHPVGLVDPAALVKEIEARLAVAGAGCATSAGTVELELVVDSAGKLTSIKILKVSGGMEGRCLARALGGLTSGARAAAASATVQLVIRGVP